MPGQSSLDTKAGALRGQPQPRDCPQIFTLPPRAPAAGGGAPGSTHCARKQTLSPAPRSPSRRGNVF